MAIYLHEWRSILQSKRRPKQRQRRELGFKDQKGISTEWSGRETEASDSRKKTTVSRKAGTKRKGTLFRLLQQPQMPKIHVIATICETGHGADRKEEESRNYSLYRSKRRFVGSLVRLTSRLVVDLLITTVQLPLALPPVFLEVLHLIAVKRNRVVA